MEYAFNIRLDLELGERIDRIRDQMSKTVPFPLTRAMVIRSLLKSGADQYEQGWDRVKASKPALRAPSPPVVEPEDTQPAETDQESVLIMSKKDLDLLGLK